MKGEGSQQDYGKRIYDNRLARFLSIDPAGNMYPELTPYQFASNRPIDGIDLDGLEFKKNSYYSLQVKPVFGISSSQTVVAYIKSNRPDYFIINNIFPENASPLGYDKRSDIVQYSSGEKIRPDYSAISSWAQAAQTEMVADEPTMQLSRPSGIGYKPVSVPTGIGSASAGLQLFMNTYNAVKSLQGDNASKAEAFKDKDTFYASINLVNNYVLQNKLTISIEIKTDLINYVNSFTNPINLLNPKSYGGLTYNQADDYNKFIRSFGISIFDAREGYGNNGNISTKPSDKNAIPYK